MSRCTYDNCDSEKIVGWGLCSKHYQSERRRGVLAYKQCSFEGCQDSVLARSLCNRHYQRSVIASNPEKYQRKWRERYQGSGGTEKARASKYKSTARGRFTKGQRRAISERGLEWTISFEEYCHLISKPCAYCTGPLPPQGVGLDRKDSEAGYTPDNVVPCCGTCNGIKSDKLSHEEMGVAMAAIKEFRSVKRP